MNTNRIKDALACPRIFALFQNRIGGDDAFLRLASLRYKEAGIGVEVYAEDQAELDRLLPLRPFQDEQALVHLRREIDLFKESDRKEVIAIAEHNKDEVFGLVIHDQPEIPDRFDEYLEVLDEVEKGLKKAGSGPYVFIEYAVGLQFKTFVRLFDAIKEMERISACVDIGHIGIRQAQEAYYRKHPGIDICGLKPDDPALPSLIGEVEAAVSSSLGAVVGIVGELALPGKPLHFHLHDGHPLSVSSPFGVSDHLSFLDEIPIPFEYKGKRSLPPMFGPRGLSRIVEEALKHLGSDRISFNLEIHPPGGRLALGHMSYLFGHRIDKTDAERMNCWLSVILETHRLLLKACRQASEV